MFYYKLKYKNDQLLLLIILKRARAVAHTTHTISKYLNIKINKFLNTKIEIYYTYKE